MIRPYHFILVLLAAITFSCKDDENNLPSVEERVSKAKAELKENLTAPANGWRLEYQPTTDAGTFLMLLTFNDDGTVTIKSDVADNGGEFYEQTVPYRIDNGLGLELVLETYGVFHYMFELDQATFGAEFKFKFDKKDGENLLFLSSSDLGIPSTLLFEPASSGAENEFSRNLAENFNAYGGNMPDVLETVAPKQQLLLNDQNISIFWTLDEAKRNIQVDFAAIGSTIDEIESENKIVNIYHVSGYSFQSGKLVFNTPLSFSIAGQKIEIAAIALNDFDSNGPALCPSGSESTPRYTGTVSGLGKATLLSSLYERNGTDFADLSIYTVNIPYLFDENNNSLSETGIISEKLPNTNGFGIIYNVELANDSIPSSSVGFFLNDGELAFREFQSTQTGNLIKLTLTDNVYISGGSTDADKQSVIDVTDEIFEGGEIYAFNFSQENVYHLYNPCNGYEIFLVR